MFSGATLGGTGTLDPTLTISIRRHVCTRTPGGLGTFTIDRQPEFFAGSFYAINIVPGTNSNSSAAVTGTATIDAGAVVVTPQLGSYTAGTHYQILTTTIRSPAAAPSPD